VEVSFNKLQTNAA